MINVSVVIPAYKAERFIEKAILSCIELREVNEVLVVIDGIFDNTLSIVQKLAKSNEKIIILFHPNQENRGAAASRNLGIKNANYEFVSFLDADDFYLNNRFEETAKVFTQFPNADGVYEAIGTFAYDEKSYSEHIDRMKACNIDNLDPELTTITEKVNPEKLFETIVTGKKGWFHFNGLTLRKECFEKSGLLNDSLNRFGEDNEFFIRLSLKAQLYPGNLNSPVAKRGVYQGNITLNTFSLDETKRKTYLGSVVLYKIILKEILTNNYDASFNKFVLFAYLDNYSVSFLMMKPNFGRKVIKLINLIGTLLTYPKLIKKIF